MIVYVNSEKEAKEIMNVGFNEIERIDKKFNSKYKDSVISLLNNSKEKKIAIDSEGKYLLEKAKFGYDLTNGKFDITISPLMKVWGFTEEEDRVAVPTKEEIDTAKKLIDFRKVNIENDQLEILEPIKEIDTGAFLKGYAMEKAKEKMVEKGLKSGFVSSISSIATIGTKPEGVPWRVGIQNPENPQNILGIIELNDESMGVSGNYQTFVEIEGKKYHHIIDKNTGFPVKEKKMVVIVNKDGLMADLLSTAFFLMENKDIFKYAESDKQLKFIIVLDDMSLLKSDNILLENR